MNYRKWMHWHNISSAFFVPLALLFIISGALLLLDVRGGTVSETIPFDGSADLLQDTPKLIELLRPKLSDRYRSLLDEPVTEMRGRLVWGRFSSRHLLVGAAASGNGLEVSVNRPSFYQLLVLAHKGRAGRLFLWFSILFAVALLFSYISGLVLAFRCFPRNTWLTLLAGLVVTALLLWLSA